MQLENRIKVARGINRAELILKNAKVVNVYSHDIHETHVAIHSGQVVGFGDYEAKEVIDLDGAYLIPGLLDGHVHVESSMLTPKEFARSVMPSGTTGVIADPHEIANVLGIEGIRYLIEANRATPLDLYMMFPSCVPATNMETAGSQLSSSDLAMYLNEKWVLGLAEMMNFPGVLNQEESVMLKIALARNAGKRIDGHAPGLSGKDLCAYIGSGVASDHECTDPQEAMEKLRLGMHIMIREGTVAKDLEALLPVITPENSRRIIFCTDDRYPHDLAHHISGMVERAVEYGINPITAIQMATINTANYFRINDVGAISPRHKADLIVLDDLKSFKPKMVFKNGKQVAQNGIYMGSTEYQELPPIRGSINVKWLEEEHFKIKAESDKIRVINVIPGQLLTKESIEDAKIVDGYAVSDTDRDILKMVVIERHRASGNIGIGFVKGFGLKEGAIASSVAHDSHNIVVVGTSDADILHAAVDLVKSQGGKVVVKNQKKMEILPLPIAGLISNKSAEEVMLKMNSLKKAAKSIGSTIDDPFMLLAFMCLPVIPELKLTDKGLVDVREFKFTSVFA
ncbi:MAG: adenine deaminase [Vampirovibrionia bacterium]